MTPKEYLSQAYKLDRRIGITLRKAQKLRSALEYTSPVPEGLGGHGSGDRMADSLVRVMEYEEQAQRLRELYIAKYIEIERAIHSVEDTVLREVLERRYLLYQKWEDIAEDMHYSQRTVFYLHGKALQRIALNCSI